MYRQYGRGLAWTDVVHGGSSLMASKTVDKDKFGRTEIRKKSPESETL